MLIMLLTDQKEKWWVTVMDVELDPELTKWSMHSGLAIILTGKGYKKYHWLVVPHQPLRLSPYITIYSCLLIAAPLLLISSPALSTI